MSITVSASLLSADTLELGSELERVKKSGCGHVHFDVMDGSFVPNISFGVPVLKGVRKGTDMPIDVHLMITRPMDYIDVFAGAGADMISFHLESECDPEKVLRRIHEAGKKAGIAIKPATAAEEVFPYLPLADYVLEMTVEPGFGGQGFMHETLDKIRAIRGYIVSEGLHTKIQVDGGINAETTALVTEAGAEILVAGSYLFRGDMAAAVGNLTRCESADK